MVSTVDRPNFLRGEPWVRLALAPDTIPNVAFSPWCASGREL